MHVVFKLKDGSLREFADIEKLSNKSFGLFFNQGTDFWYGGECLCVEFTENSREFVKASDIKDILIEDEKYDERDRKNNFDNSAPKVVYGRLNCQWCLDHHKKVITKEIYNKAKNCIGITYFESKISVKARDYINKLLLYAMKECGVDIDAE